MRVIIRTKGSGVAFVHPFDPGAKTVVLAPGFRKTRNVRVFPDGWCERAARYQPSAVAAPLEEMRRLVLQGVNIGNVAIVLTRGTPPQLTPEDREVFWEAFGVPVFEQCLGPRNQLLAAECEAHDGLHVIGEQAEGSLETGVCGCGRATPRLIQSAIPDYMPEREFMESAMLESETVPVRTWRNWQTHQT